MMNNFNMQLNDLANLSLGQSFSQLYNDENDALVIPALYSDCMLSDEPATTDNMDSSHP